MSPFNFTREEAEVVLSALKVKIAQQLTMVGIVDGYTVAVAESLERLLAEDAVEAPVEEAPVEAVVEEAPAEEAPAE